MDLKYSKDDEDEIIIKPKAPTPAPTPAPPPPVNNVSPDDRGGGGGSGETGGAGGDGGTGETARSRPRPSLKEMDQKFSANLRRNSQLKGSNHDIQMAAVRNSQGRGGAGVLMISR